jgi:hypothetical protein
MKRLLFLIPLLLLSTFVYFSDPPDIPKNVEAWGGLVIFTAGETPTVGGSSCDDSSPITDAFDGTGTTVTGWTEEVGDWGHSVAGDQLDNEGADREDLIRNDTAVCSANQWACIQVVAPANGIFAGPMLRATAGSGSRYSLYCDDDRCVWDKIDYDGNNWTKVQNFCSSGCDTTVSISVGANEYICAYVSGTGASTVMKAWINPTTPTGGPTTWQSEDGNPDIDHTEAGGVDSGLSVGVHVYSTSGGKAFDNFVAGPTE